MQLSKKRTFFVDIATILLCYSPIVISLFITFFCLEKINEMGFKVLVFPFLLQLSFVATIFAIRILLPKLKPGVYATGFNKDFLAWYCHSMLTRSARCMGIQYLLHTTAAARWLYWSALGVKVPYNMSSSYKLTIHDAAMITISEGVILSEDVNLSGHLIRGDKILVAAVKIGKNVFVGRNTYIGPRTRIGDFAWIGMGNTLSGDVVAEKQVIKSHEWSRGNPLKAEGKI